MTRLHVRYDAAHFPEDLAFHETGDRTNFQGRFVIRHPWTGVADCSAAAEYRRALRERQSKEAETLAHLTGWSLDRIRRKISAPDEPTEPAEGPAWWDRLWKTGSR